jgi:hypothetical protein
MKNKITILLTIYLLSNLTLYSQNTDKMNKSELREQIVVLTTKIDSLKNETVNLQDSISKLTLNSSLLEQKSKTNEDEISRINKLILKNEIERKRIITENEITTSKLNEKILTLKDSISSVQPSSNVVSTSSTFNSNDFLNKYYFNQIPLPNNSFSLVLSKLVYGETYIISNRDGNYNTRYARSGITLTLPEILDANNFKYWGIKPNVLINRNIDNTNINNFLISQNSDYLNSKLPKIEILKNKLLTFKYNDGSEESFLFNVNQIKYKNNQRKIFQIEMANEEVKEDGTNNDSRDIMWRFFVIENECYLALNAEQLERIKLKFFNHGSDLLDSLRDSNYNDYTTTGQEIYLSRNKDIYMDNSDYVNQQDIIYLFKLK